MSEKKVEMTESEIKAKKRYFNHLTSEEVTKAVGLLDSWFIKASWHYKKDFLFSGLDLLGKEGLEQIILFLGPPTKDFYYSTVSAVNYLDDITPLDDDRQMMKETLDRVRNSDLEWLASLPPQQTVNILTGLTELGGGSLRTKLFDRATFICGQLSTSVSPKVKSSHKKAAKDDTEFLSEINKGSKEYHTYKKSLDEYDDFVDRMKKKMSRNEQSESRTTQRRKSDTNNSKNQEVVDFVQLLPSWINRQIFMYLDEDSLSKCQKVNAYWKNVIKKLNSERDVREKIDAVMSEMEIQEITNITRDVRTKEGKGKSSKNEKKKKKSSPKTPQISPSQEMFEKNRVSIVSWDDSDRLAMINTFASAKDRLAFRKRHLLIWTLNEYTEGRAVAVGKNWLALSRNNVIVLSNLFTFAVMPGDLRGHTGEVTSLVFHPEDGQMISAAKDSTLRRWDVWSRQEVLRLDVPSIKEVAANKKYFVAAGINIKVFCWEKNTLVWTFDLEESILNSVCISSNDIIFTSISPGIIKILDVNIGCLMQEIPRFHLCNMTYIYNRGKYLATGNEEGWVYIWNIHLPKPLMLARRNFERTQVKAVALLQGCLMAATDTGMLYIWDVAVNEIIQSTVINSDNMPIISLSLLNYNDHCKVVINTEMGIKVLQFQYERKQKKKSGQGFQSPQICRVIMPELDSSNLPKLITTRDERKNQETRFREEFMMRQCCHPKLRRDMNQMLTISEPTCSLRYLLGGLTHFPRLNLKTKNQEEGKKPEETQGSVEHAKFIKHTVQEISYKNFLPIHNPYKQQF